MISPYTLAGGLVLLLWRNELRCVCVYYFVSVHVLQQTKYFIKRFCVVFSVPHRDSSPHQHCFARLMPWRISDQTNTWKLYIMNYLFWMSFSHLRRYFNANVNGR